MPAQTETVAGTLAGGIQDVAAILPLIGTEHIETHVGSALEGGYLYAAAAPLSIFGCLGIVKAGVAVLISSISIPRIPTSLRRRYKSILRDRWLGTRMLHHAGVKLRGRVAPLIAMDGKHYRAETQLLRMLEEKHIDDPENISIEWNLEQWNVKLALSTLLAGALSIIPYIALLLGSTSLQPVAYLPWLFPILRAVGSCLASICIQLLIQSRIISLMKNRILFMTIHRRLVANVSKDSKADFDSWLRDWVHWDPDLPSEECISSLEQFLCSRGLFAKPSYKDDPKEPGGYVAINVDDTTPTSPPPDTLFEDQIDCDTIHHLRNKHFATNLPYDRYTTLITWLALFLSIPAILVGYIGCFKLVRASSGNGSLVWLGYEVTLSIVRLLAWSGNPKPHDSAGITIALKITQHLSMDSTRDYKPHIHEMDDPEKNLRVFGPGSQFMESIAPYTGLQNSENVTLYFTLTPTDDGGSADSDDLDDEEEYQSPWSWRCGCQQSKSNRR